MSPVAAEVMRKGGLVPVSPGFGRSRSGQSGLFLARISTVRWMEKEVGIVLRSVKASMCVVLTYAMVCSSMVVRPMKWNGDVSWFCQLSW